MEYMEIIIYAAIAAFVLARLWSVFGQRGDDEPQRPNPFAQHPGQKPEDSDGDDDVVVLSDGAKSAAASGQPPALTAGGHASSSLAGILDQIKSKDAAFDEKKFLQGAKAAFAMIVESFAKGDMPRIEKLLAPAVLKRFALAVEDRNNEGRKQQCLVASVSSADIIRARLDGNTAFVTVDFVSNQSNATFDANGKRISGDPNLIEEIRDVWTFCRDLSSSNPNWQLAETE